MLLTLYYMAATWVQSWRLSAMRSKIMQMVGRNGSLVLYNEPESLLSDKEGVLNLQLTSISSQWCLNKSEAQIGDLVWFGNNKRGCSLYPTQRLDVTHWISFRDDKSLFPIELSGSSKVTLCDELKLHLLIEADYSKTPVVNHDTCCQVHLEEFGILRAWRADELMGVVLETDVEHFSKLATNFMNRMLKMDDGMELLRIETVSLEGHPCRLLNTDSIPIVRRNRAMTPDRWRTHVDLLISLSQAADLAVAEGGQLAVPGYDWAVIGAAQAFMLDSPTRPPEDAAKAETSSLVQCDPPGNSTAGLAPGPVDDRPRTPDSLYSLSQETVDAHEEAVVIPRPAEDERSSDSFCSLDSASTASAASHLASRPAVEPKLPCSPARVPGPPMKPPNVLVYSESSAALDSVKSVLRATLHNQKYLVYSLTLEQLLTTPWSDHARLLVVWGAVPDRLAPALVNYLLGGGQLLCLCSDLLLRVLPAFQTAEVREKELVRFSYSRWKRVPLMHHVFCYQASPSKAKFSDDHKSWKPPASVEMVDLNGHSHTLEVLVLGYEETWHTPSLLLATVRGTKGRAVFSQIHLETNPVLYEEDEEKHKALKESDGARLEILRDLLATHLGLECVQNSSIEYTPAYFLGIHELKQEFLDKLQSRLQPDGVLKLANVSLQMCGKGVKPCKANNMLMPVLLHACPDHFSTVEYFENLTTSYVGRLVLFSDVMASSMSLLEGPALHNGLAIVPAQQTGAVGRSGNGWLSPLGCAMFSLQLQIPTDSYLGQRITFIQHVAALAIVKSVRELPGYEALDICLKWPNDIYAGAAVKVGGLMVNVSIQDKVAVCNMGSGVNLSNKSPTICINDMIVELNKATKQNLPPLKYERLLALAFSEMERLIEKVQGGNKGEVLQLYYKYWLHSNARVSVVGARGSSQTVTVIGIDEYGFLVVRTDNGKSFVVQPDGNSFDMLRGLIAPKVN